MQPKWEVADVVRKIRLSDEQYSPHQQKTLRAIASCRTSVLGGHIDACDGCGRLHISYNSCRNRHCPKCQGHQREEWIQNREQELLPCTYYHVVFTLPDELYGLALHAPKEMYAYLFQSAWATLNQFGHTTGIQLGMISILHTWGQTMSLHPHVHCIVPGGGIDKDGKWKKQIRSNKFLYSVKAMSKVFRAKYVACLRRGEQGNQQLYDTLFEKEWVVYAKRPFGGPKQVLEYLGRYTHKVAISNHRIIKVTESTTSFKYKDYRDGGKTKEMKLSNEEFVRRFSMHILPSRFVRIRHYGILSSSWKRGKLQLLQKELQVSRPLTEVKTMLRKCPYCKIGTLITIEIFGQRGPPEAYILGTRPIPKS